MGGFLILAGLTGAVTAIVLARKREIAEAFFRAGGRLPGPSKDAPRSYRVENPGRRSASIVQTGRFGRGLNMNRVTSDGRVTPHYGIDITASEGTPVYAAMDGTVRRVDEISGYGKVIMVEHGQGGPVTLYAHLSRQGVTEGQRVQGGQQIGDVGRTTAGSDGVVPSWGRTMGAHLHMEVHQSWPPDLRMGAGRRGIIDPVLWLNDNGITFSGNRTV